MRVIPATESSLVVRTDFSDQAAWESVCTAIRQPVGVFQFQANVEFYSEPDLDGVDTEGLMRLVPPESRSFMFIVDRVTLSNPERPILVLDLFAQPGRAFRVVPSEMWSVENNLSIANMDFDEFADAAGEDGIFRGFPQ